MAGLQSGEGRMMVDSVIWAQYINMRHTHRQPRRHGKCRANALRRAAKIGTKLHFRSERLKYLQEKVLKAISFAEMPQSDHLISNVTITKFFHQLAGGNNFTIAHVAKIICSCSHRANTVSFTQYVNALFSYSRAPAD